MTHREDLAKMLLECLREVESLLEHAHDVAVEEQRALVESNAEALTLTCHAQEEVLRRIGEADQRAAAVAVDLCAMSGVDPETAGPNGVAQAAGQPYGQLIQDELSNISEAAIRVQQANAVNRQLLSNGLDIITNCLRTLAAEPRPISYSRSAAITNSESYVLSLNRKV